jgi:murein DD-endopeptidase MepM/ murein hydrolase activator NlpD
MTVGYRRDVRFDCKQAIGFGSTVKRNRGRYAVAAALGVLIATLWVSSPGLARFATMFERPSEARVTRIVDLPSTSNPSGFSSASAFPYPFEPLTPAKYASGYRTVGIMRRGGDAETWQEITVRPGDNMSLIFSRLGLKYAELHDILSSSTSTSGLKDLQPGQKIRFVIDDGRVTKLLYEQDLLHALHVSRVAGQFHSRLIISEPDRHVRSAGGIIDSSLFLSGQAAGLTDNIIMQLADIFGWDIDFVLDIRQGDRFAVIHEEFFKDGHKIRDGSILAAEFVNRGRVYRAIRYVTSDGRSNYYSDKGDAMRKAFLRTPVNFTRISSRFNLARRHPILNTIRAHKGVDYAAPHGTPVIATGDGKVDFVGTNGGYGKMIVLRHGGSYSTAYAHLARYARDLKPGRAVSQGQVIGYVGQSGLATGPHLHYEFRVNGVHRNPLKVPFPKAEPIAAEYLEDFKSKAAPLLAQLEAVEARFARRNDGDLEKARDVDADFSTLAAASTVR